MIIKCYDGSEIDTDKLDDVSSLVHERVSTIHNELIALKIPHLIKFYDYKGIGGGASAFTHPTDSEQVAVNKTFGFVKDFLEACNPGYELMWKRRDTA